MPQRPCGVGPSNTPKVRRRIGRPTQSHGSAAGTNGRNKWVVVAEWEPPSAMAAAPSNCNVLCSPSASPRLSAWSCLGGPGEGRIDAPNRQCWGCLNPGRLLAVVGISLRNLASGLDVIPPDCRDNGFFGECAGKEASTCGQLLYACDDLES